MGESAEELRRDIERSRDHMGDTLDAIGDRVSPSRIIERRRNRIFGAVTNMREAVMGTTHNTTSAVGDRLSALSGTVSDGAGGVTDSMSHAAQMARQQAQGNPFAAGPIAFGGGLLAAALFPPSEPERQLAHKVQDAAAALGEPAQQIAHELAATVQERGQQAVETLKDSAGSAAQAVKETATSNAQDTKQAGQNAAQQLTHRANPS
jgi:hypothetical protein